MNNEKLHADIKRKLRWPISTKKLAELLNRCYVALGEQQSVPDDHIEQALAMVPDGWQLVPVEPTPEMMKAGCAVPLNKAARHNSCYRAMLAAAPSAPKADDPVKVQLLEALTDSLELMETLCAFEGDTIRKARAAIAAALKEGGK